MSLLMQFIISQTLNSPLLASGKSTRAPLIFLPIVFYINYSLFSYFCCEPIMNTLYFYTPTCSFKIQSFMYKSEVDLFLMILPILITTFRAIIESWQLQAFIPAMLEERTVPMILIFFLNSPSFIFLLIPPIISFLMHLLCFFLPLPFIQQNSDSGTSAHLTTFGGF